MDDFKREATITAGALTLLTTMIGMAPIAIMVYLGVHRGFLALVVVLVGLMVLLNLLTLATAMMGNGRRS